MIPDGAVGRPTDRTRAPAAHTAPPRLLLCGIQTWKAGRVSERSCDWQGTETGHRRNTDCSKCVPGAGLPHPWQLTLTAPALRPGHMHLLPRAAATRATGRAQAHPLPGVGASALLCPPLASSICWPPWRRGLYRHHLVPASVTMSPSRPLFLRTLVMGLRAALFRHETLS